MSVTSAILLSKQNGAQMNKALASKFGATLTNDNGAGSSVPDFDPTAWIALVLSIVGLLVSILLRYLDGPRVRVRMRPVLFGVGHSGTLTYHGGGWPIPDSKGGAELRRPDPGEVIELAEIVIENCGRHPMTVYEIGFRWLGKRNGWWRRRVRLSSVPIPIRPPHYEGRVYAEGDQFRIEPSDVVTVLVDYWDLVRSHRPTPNGNVELRAAVRVAGRRHLKTSPWKLRWRIPDNAVTSVGMAKKIPVRAVISKSIGLSLLYSKAETLGDISFLSRSLESALQGKWADDFKTNHERLERFEADSEVHFLRWKDNWARATLMFGVQHAIDDYKEDIDWEDIAQPGLHKAFSRAASLDDGGVEPARSEGSPADSEVEEPAGPESAGHQSQGE